jgi:UDP-N-acetylglucosamine--N-acetylmuramyl-(pentapeptide) pyrophosphoryl-undecaprenol N-acetylglucosamine transferase
MPRLCPSASWTGNPRRAGFRAPVADASEDGRLRVFVMGGSQGARVFSTVLPEALARLPAERRARLRLVQQARAEDLDHVRQRYAELGIEAEIASFFDDVPRRLAGCDVVIARSGASTVAEVTACGRPALYVPYAHAADDHQYVNAARVAEAGGGVVLRELDASPEKLADAINELANNPERLSAMAAAARSFARPDATVALADLVLSVVEPDS